MRIGWCILGPFFVAAVACSDPAGSELGAGGRAGDGGAKLGEGGGWSRAGMGGEDTSGGTAEGGSGGSALAGGGGDAGEPATDGGSSGTVFGGSGGAPEAGSGGAPEGGTGGSEPEFVPEIPEVDESAVPEPESETGFIDIEGVQYRAPIEFQEPELESTSTKLFYNFIAADSGAKEKPVFVFFNGGPGYTSMHLKAFGTGPHTLDAEDLDAEPKRNAASFSSLGSLLYIDARQAGFSYGVAESPSDEAERGRAFQKGSFNPTSDAADFVRVLVRVLAKIPGIRNNPVVLVGQSYGGARAALMLELLTEPDGHSEGALYRDVTLEAELTRHFEAVFPGVPAGRIGRLARAKQFGWQVLIQPLVAGQPQLVAASRVLPDVEARMAQASGITLEQLREQRCRDDRSRSLAWCEDVENAVARTVTSPELFERIMGLPPELVNGLAAADRQNGFRFIEESADRDPAALRLRLGELPAWDTYFSLWTSGPVPVGAFGQVSRGPLLGLVFTRILRHTHTMITNAVWDANILSESIVPALMETYEGQAEPWITEAEFVPAADGERPTRFRVRFSDVMTSPGVSEQEVFFPTYAESGHFVSVSQPEKFRQDVETFLAETGLGG